MRAGIFIDGITLFHGLDGKRFHFKDFKEWLLNGDEDGYSAYFNSVEILDTKETFFLHVKKSGFDVFIRKPKYDYVLKKIDITDMNIELATEAMNHADKFDKFVIVSGKHDFLPLCEKMSDKGKDVEVIGFRNNINPVFNKYPIRYIETFFD